MKNRKDKPREPKQPKPPPHPTRKDKGHGSEVEQAKKRVK